MLSSVDVTTARAARARMEINFSALGKNIDYIAKHSAPARIMAVVKGNAYGLGALDVAQFLASAGVQAFAVDNIAEALELRMGGIKLPILVLDGGIADNCEIAILNGITPGIPHVQLLQAYQQAAQKLGVQHPVWLVSNVGFNRAGYRRDDQITRFAELASRCANLQVEGLYAHMTNSNVEDSINDAQISLYFRQLDAVRCVLGDSVQSSLFASHAIPRWASKVKTNWIRPGILMYGEHIYDDTIMDDELRQFINDLQPVVSLQARISGMLEFEAAEAVGYGQKSHVQPGQRLATVAFGFGSGYPRGVFPAYGILRGCRVPLFGAIGMDALQVDITDLSEPSKVSMDDWVTLIGQTGEVKISVSDLAKLSNVSPYELLSNLTVPCFYPR